MEGSHEEGAALQERDERHDAQAHRQLLARVPAADDPVGALPAHVHESGKYHLPPAGAL